VRRGRTFPVDADLLPAHGFGHAESRKSILPRHDIRAAGMTFLDSLLTWVKDTLTSVVNLGKEAGSTAELHFVLGGSMARHGGSPEQ
jgi:hypothetical protein